jgi:4'-phosphopantetheinyl transferase EntD
MGQRPGPILPGPHGAAVWPPGIVGSMTHCPGYSAAVVAFARDVTSIGIDAEPDEPLPEGVVERIASADERERLAALALARPAISWDRLLLCTKEAVYKAWHPLVHRWIDFLEADVTLDPLERTFVARLLSGGPVVDGGTVARFDGRWVASGGLLVTVVVLPRPFSASHPGPSSHLPRCAS